MEATPSTEGAPQEDLAWVEALSGKEVPTDSQDASGDTSDAEGGMVATNGDRERMQEGVEKVLGIVLPLRAGLPDGFPAVFTMHPTPLEQDTRGFREWRTWMFQPAPQGTHYTIRP